MAAQATTAIHNDVPKTPTQREGTKQAMLIAMRQAPAGWIPARVASAKWLPWIPKRIQRAKIVISQAADIEALFPRSTVRWIPPGFPGETACR